MFCSSQYCIDSGSCFNQFFWVRMTSRKFVCICSPDPNICPPYLPCWYVAARKEHTMEWKLPSEEQAPHNFQSGCMGI